MILKSSTMKTSLLTMAAVGAGAAVNFTINGKTITAFTDAEGIAKVEITDVPGTYEVTTTYNNQTFKNSVIVNLNPSTCKIAENKDIKVDYDGGKYFSVKIVSADGKVAASGVSVKFTINGKSTTVKTDAKGIAKIKITDVPKKYTMTTTFNGNSVKNTVTVKQVLKDPQNQRQKGQRQKDNLQIEWQNL